MVTAIEIPDLWGIREGRVVPPRTTPIRGAKG
jgi:hypothetical protein